MTSNSVSPEDQAAAIERHPILSALSSLPEEERTQVLALIYQRITHSAPAVSESVAMMEMLPEDDRRRFLDEMIADGALDRETRRRNADEDIEDRRAVRRHTTLAAAAGWLIVAGSLLGAGIGLYLVPAAWIGWVCLAAIGVGGPAAISLVARNSRIRVELVAPPGDQKTDEAS